MRRRPSIRARVTARVALRAFVLAGFCVALILPASAAASPGVAGGYGATMPGWLRAHGANSADCAQGGCYGPLVNAATPEPEFSFLVMIRHRVVGYDQALRKGTPLLQAELEVAEEFPSDVEMARQLTVIHRDRYGHSCAVYDLYSKSLAKMFGRRGPGDEGDTIGVELATVGRSGTTTFHGDRFNLAIVTPVYLDGSTNC